jgi:hypothetical protein
MRTGIAIVVAAAALGALAATVVGDPGEGGPGIVPAADAPTLEAQRVPAPAAAKGGEQGPRVVYKETANRIDGIPPGPGGYIVEKCPKSSVAVNGYYFQEVRGETGGWVGVFDGFGLDDQGSSPAGYRRWAFYYDNLAPAAIDGVTFGIICDKDG